MRSAELPATTIEAEEVPRLVDELPLFALLASHARGESVVNGAGELRVKETDRIETVSTRSAPSASASATRRWLLGHAASRRARGAARSTLDGDHRIAMLGAVAGLASREGVEIEGAEAVAISFPGFFELLEPVTQR